MARNSPARDIREPLLRAATTTTATAAAASKDGSLDKADWTADPTHPSKTDVGKDFGNIVLLVVLYMLQGVPLGLSMGSVPFLLKSKLSFSDLALFSLSSYPYSLK
eukprot:jgi/Hompol1/3328/HPOL_003202-RA